MDSPTPKTDMEDEEEKVEFMSEIEQLQEAVAAMKSAFTTAQLQLVSIGLEDKTLYDEMVQTKSHCQQQTSEILRLVLSLKSEIIALRETLETTQLIQHGLDSRLHATLLERDLLLQELGKNGAISEQLRDKLLRCRERELDGCGGVGRSSSGSHDSGVAFRLQQLDVEDPEDGRRTGAPSSSSNSANNLSGDKFLSSNASHHVQSYLNTLNGNGNGNAMNNIISLPVSESKSCLNGHRTEEENDYPSLESSSASENNAAQCVAANESDVNSRLVYDSDSSLTVAAAAALSLSNSLSKQCGLELDQNAIQTQNANSTTKQRLNDTDDEAIEPSSVAASTRLTGKNSQNLQLSFEELQRLRVAKELAETERKYCRTLQTIQDVFANPLRASNVLTIRDINTLFPEEVDRMQLHHCALLAQLEHRIADWTPESSVGDLIEGFTRVDGSNILRLYTSYVNDFPEVLKTFHKLCRANGEFTRFLKRCLEQPICGGLDLGAFLLTPVQRMPRYILLLKQMLKWTDPGHRDHKNITVSLNRLRDYLTKLNDSMEHSFQLVTAQIIPKATPEFDRNQARATPIRGSALRTSTSSESQAEVEDNSEIEQKMTLQRYRRSSSASRPPPSANVTPRRDSAGTLCSKINKLRSKSKSDWVVSKKDKEVSCNKYLYYEDEDDFQETPHPRGANSATTRQGLERSISDSDFNSDPEDGSAKARKKISERIQTSKSLHDFSNRISINDEEEEDFDWTISDPSLCFSGNDTKANLQPQPAATVGLGHTVVRKKTLLRPFLPPPSTPRHEALERQLVRIERGSQPDLNRKSKKTSLRASLKNIFSLKKRYAKPSSTTSSTAESIYYRVVYTDSHHCTSRSSLSVAPPPPDDFGPNLIKYMHRMPSYLELVMFSVKETTV